MIESKFSDYGYGGKCGDGCYDGCHDRRFDGCHEKRFDGCAPDGCFDNFADPCYDGCHDVCHDSCHDGCGVARPFDACGPARPLDTCGNVCNDGCNEGVPFDNFGTPEPISIDANRIYDSCGDKDCLSDLRVYFTKENQDIINEALSVRLIRCEVINVLIDVEPVPFNRGYFSIDLTYFFECTLDVFTTPGGIPVVMSGLAIFSKRAVLFGSEGNVKVFSSEITTSASSVELQKTLPKVKIQVTNPIPLSGKLKEHCGHCPPPCKIPEPILNHFGEEIVQPSNKSVLVTLGLFSIIHIERPVQVLVPSFNFSIPEKKCFNSSANPCELFDKIDFPAREFFPPDMSELSDGDPFGKLNFGCGCAN